MVPHLRGGGGARGRQAGPRRGGEAAAAPAGDTARHLLQVGDRDSRYIVEADADTLIDCVQESVPGPGRGGVPVPDRLRDLEPGEPLQRGAAAGAGGDGHLLRGGGGAGADTAAAGHRGDGAGGQREQGAECRTRGLGQ